MTCGMWIARLKPWMMTFRVRPFCAWAPPNGSIAAVARPAAERANCRRGGVIGDLSDMGCLLQALPDLAQSVGCAKSPCDALEPGAAFGRFCARGRLPSYSPNR